MTLRSGDAGGAKDANVGSGGAFVLTLATGGLPFGGGGIAALGGVRGFGGSGGGAGGGGGGLSRGGNAGHAGDSHSEDARVNEGGTQSTVDGLCYDNGVQLWDEITREAAPAGFCVLAIDGGMSSYGRRVKLVFDGEGRIVENTGIDDNARRQEWLASLADKRWPCLAGQEVAYVCITI